MNTKYGKLVDGQIVYAPNTLDTEDGKKMNPSEASYLAAQDFAEDNDLFIEGRKAIQGYLGVSDEFIESILTKCVAD